MRLLKYLDAHLEEFLLFIMLCAMVVVMGIQVTARYVFSYSLSWSEEITRYLFIWSGFLSISYCVKRNAAVKIEQFVNMFPGKIPNILNLVNYLIQLLFFSYMLPFALNYVQSGKASGQLSPACGIPMYLVQMVTIIGFVLAVIRLIQRMVHQVNALVAPETKEEV